ncbi:hypothetical protein C7B64_01705 [Merismopedia glauca CCAP 1448/3]|uniref:NACHT domain-containing protein n=2 Tax=Merismopedia TaxID=53402 RepID=A0A2T1CA19_9CYAN|nr:hypothetical protein C7B64_01705 [Merismopedia glauca CCAP 1448/3]
MLGEQQRLTTDPLTSGEGIAYRTEQVYVPLGLVERKRQTRRREDVSPDRGSELYQETEITQTFEHQQFLEQVLKQRQSPKSQGKRIAIIGEPGAGKTTLLQQISRWVSGEMAQSVAIWVSLADLQGRELESYLFEVWVQAVARKVGQAEASTQVKDDFVAQFNQGLVWLLLDGVDEMQATGSNPLAEIERQIRTGTLLQQARMVLSCRLNLWDGGSNALDSFDNYRTLEFSYPQQVEQFIINWFGSLPSAETQTGQRLCAALRESGKERIRDLVKNPLRLTLLCFNWYLGEGKLPETKAGLYEQFVADFYEWKKGQFATTGEQRKRLNAALGELAREAIDKEATRFRLRHNFVCEYLGEPDDADSLFGLALRLGWLNKVGVDGDNLRKGVYAFFHPTFQEYFASKDFCDRADFYNLAKHIGKNTWNEIFILSLEMANDPDTLMRLMKKQTDELLSSCAKLQQFLSYTYQKSMSVNIPYKYKPAALRAFYLKTNRCSGFCPSNDLAFGIDPTLRNDCSGGTFHGIYADIHICFPSPPQTELHLDETLDAILANDLNSSPPFFSLRFLGSGVDLNYNFKKLLEDHLAQLPKSETFQCWWKERGSIWLKHLRNLSLEYRAVGQDWQFSEEQKELLMRYYSANQLLVHCLNSCSRVSNEVKKEIETTLLLPVTAIEKGT